jgi:hypothetical protein
MTGDDKIITRSLKEVSKISGQILRIKYLKYMV